MATDNEGRPIYRRALTVTGSTVIFGGYGWYLGASLVETGGVSPVRAQVFDGASGSGLQIDALGAPANLSDHTNYDATPVLVEQGLFVNFAGAGAGTLVVYYAAGMSLLNFNDPIVPDITGSVDA